MNDWQQGTLEDYQQKGLAARSGYGTRPALVMVDFINGFTDPASPLGGEFSGQLEVTKRLLGEFRRARLPVVYTTIASESDFRDAGLFIKKIPSLSVLAKGSPMVEIDDRIRPQNGEYVVLKKYASAFFETSLDTYLKSHGIDTVIMTGCTTSGCIRASANDAMQHGYRTVVVREGVGDRAEGPHEANLFDIDAKIGDVVSISEALEYLRSLADAGGIGTRVSDDFQRWWNQSPTVDA